MTLLLETKLSVSSLLLRGDLGSSLVLQGEWLWLLLRIMMVGPAQSTSPIVIDPVSSFENNGGDKNTSASLEALKGKCAMTCRHLTLEKMKLGMYCNFETMCLFS